MVQRWIQHDLAKVGGHQLSVTVLYLECMKNSLLEDSGAEAGLENVSDHGTIGRNCLALE